MGLGAVGTLLAYFLNQAGHVPYAVVRKGGGRVLKWGGEQRVEVRLVETLPPDVKYALVAVKAYDTEEALPKIRGFPVVFQNGVGGLELVRERLGVGAGAVLTYGVWRRGEVVEVAGVGEVILPEEAGEVGDVLKRGGANVRIVRDVEPYRWLKLAVNAGINPVTALLRAKNGVMLESKHAAELAASAAREAAAVARMRGVGLPADPVEELFRVAAATRENRSSMLQDLSECRRTEVDFINGAVVKYGKPLGASVSVNETLWKLVKAAEETCLS